MSWLALAFLGGAAALTAPTTFMHQRPAATRAKTRSSAQPRMVLAQPAATVHAADLIAPPLLSGLQGKALELRFLDVPSKSEVRAVVPDHCFYTTRFARSATWRSRRCSPRFAWLPAPSSYR